MSLIKLLASNNYIIYNKEFAKKYGVEEAILLGAMCGYQTGFENDYFYREQEKIIEDTALTLYSVRNATKTLQSLQILEIKKMGLPAKHYYKINEEKLDELFRSRPIENDRSRDTENDRSRTIENQDNINNENKNNKNINNIKENIKEIFDYWNLQKIIKHEKLTKIFENAINTTLKEYSVEEIKVAIDNYNTMLNDKNYEYCNYVWSIDKFLRQKNALPEFTENGGKWLNYQNFINKSKNKEQTRVKSENEMSMNEKLEIAIKNIMNGG